MKPKYLSVLFGCWITPITLVAQVDTTKSNRNHLEFSAGTQIGATTPLTMPNAIRSIDAFKPSLPFYLGVQYNYFLKNNVGIKSGIIIEGRGMYTEATVKGYYTKFESGDQQAVTGYYYGTISTHFKNIYLSLPLSLHYNTNSWQHFIGLNASLAIYKQFSGQALEGYIRDTQPTGEKIGMSNVSYEFNNSVRNFNLGVHLGTQYKVYKNLYAQAQVNFGINNTLSNQLETISYSMHHLYLSCGLHYKLNK